MTWLTGDWRWVYLTLALAFLTAAAGLIIAFWPHRAEAQKLEAELDAEDPTKEMRLGPLLPLPAAHLDGPGPGDAAGRAGPGDLAAGAQGVRPGPRSAVDRGRPVDLPGRYDSDVPAPAGEHHERHVTLAQAKAEAADWLDWDEFQAWEQEMQGLIGGAWDWYYGADRPWSDMTGQLEPVRE